MLGELAAKAPRPVEDPCRASYVDWYGNARAIFYRDRLLSLLGYEPIEAKHRHGRVAEVARSHLYRDLPR